MTSRYRSHAPFGIGAEQLLGVGELGSPPPTEQAVDREISLNAVDEERYRKVTDWFDAHAHQKILFLELGVGRITPAFIQEPFWALTAQSPQASYIAVNNKTQFLPRAIEDRGLAVRADIADVLADVRKTLGK